MNYKPIIVGAGIAGGLYLAYEYLIKPNIEGGNNDSQLPPPTPTPQQQTNTVLNQVVQGASSIPSGTMQLDSNKVLRPGFPASTELKYSKIAFNSIIDAARKNKGSVNPLFPDFQEWKKRVERVAGLTLLDINTKYGKGTEDVAKVILGATDFTYNRVKDQKIAFFKKLGLPNPY